MSEQLPETPEEFVDLPDAVRAAELASQKAHVQVVEQSSEESE
jgi:hypothetical protein